MATVHNTPGPRHRFGSSLELYRFYARPKRVRSAHVAKAGPLPDEPEFNEQTARDLRESMAGKGLVRYETWDDLFADLGM